MIYLLRHVKKVSHRFVYPIGGPSKHTHARTHTELGKSIWF